MAERWEAPGFIGAARARGTKETEKAGLVPIFPGSADFDPEATCVYCDLNPATTADHEFSRQFFLVRRTIGSGWQLIRDARVDERPIVRDFRSGARQQRSGGTHVVERTDALSAASGDYPDERREAFERELMAVREKCIAEKECLLFDGRLHCRPVCAAV